MSFDTLRHYIAQLPASPEPGRPLYRTGADQVGGRHAQFNLRSVYQPIVGQDGTVFGHQAYFRATDAGGEAVLPQAVLEANAGEEAVVRFDRLCRTLHALNRFAATGQWSPLFLGVDHRLLRYVPEEHGTTFQRVLTGFGVLTSRVVIVLPQEAELTPGLLENVLPSYRLRNFRIAIKVSGRPAALAPRIERLRPDFVIGRWDDHAQSWVRITHAAGGRFVATHIEQPAQHDAALLAGADFQQGYQIGRPGALDARTLEGSVA